jgi:hypothetical protein
MVHQLMSQLSRARMEKMSVLKGADGMTLQVGAPLYIERDTRRYIYIYIYREREREREGKREREREREDVGA